MKINYKKIYTEEDVTNLALEGVLAKQLRRAYRMIPKNKKRSEKATAELLNADWYKISVREINELLKKGAKIPEDKDKYSIELRQTIVSIQEGKLTDMTLTQRAVISSFKEEQQKLEKKNPLKKVTKQQKGKKPLLYKAMGVVAYQYAREKQRERQRD